MKSHRSLLQITSSNRAIPTSHVRRLAVGLLPRDPWRLSYALLLIGLFARSPAWPAELRVPGDHATITAAIAAAKAGDTIRVAPGTYSASSEVFPLRLDKAISLEGDPNNRPHLQGDNRHTAVLIESGGVTLRGFQITDANGSEGINNMDGGGICVFVGPGETRDVSIVYCLIENNRCPTDETYDGCGGGIYCGGTYCRCFSVNISNCTIRNNVVHGCGGGVFCALLSNVHIENTAIEDNAADDHGGGVYVDVFASLDLLKLTSLVANHCFGDPKKANWGGKGGGLACESYGVFTVTDCNIVQNTAEHYGGGIFTRGGDLEDFSDLRGEGACVDKPSRSSVSNSRINRNFAKRSGGGVYMAASAKLHFSGTTFYWNDANDPNGDGGAVFVAGSTSAGGIVTFDANCVLEGNESARHGGGVYLGSRAKGTFDSTKFLGNSVAF